MPVIFEDNRGRLVELPESSAQCSIRLKLSQPIGFRTERAIITAVSLNQEANVQFLHTLGSHVYVYVFGDRMGDIKLSGLAFDCACPKGDNQSGADRILRWYHDNRVSVKDHVQITIGETSFFGFVIGFSEQVIDAARALTQWEVSMATLPEAQ